ncbi:MAG TPA: DUF4097 family beta strand repeat-containing protein [Mycobacteriales bacterium]|nr:DUF4097 family beta strand repeat-containing protein [Mycobacteriales bacterium]
MSTPRSHTFQTPEPIELDIQNLVGEIRVNATGRGETRVDLIPMRGNGGTRDAVDNADVEFANGRLRIACQQRQMGRGHPISVSVTAPAGSSVRVKTATADVTVSGRIDSLDATTASGEVTAEDIDGEAEVRTASGGITLGAVTGDVRSRTVSGDLRVGRAGALHAESASGDLSVRDLGGSANLKTASGNLHVGRVARGELAVMTASGNVRIGLAQGALAHLEVGSLSGSVRNELPVEDEPDSPPQSGEVVDIRARTLSGDIRIGRAEATRGA